MSERKYIVVSPIGRWGRFLTFAGKVGTGSSCYLLIKRARRFYVEQRIEFAMEHELRGCSKAVAVIMPLLAKHFGFKTWREDTKEFWKIVIPK